MSLLRSLINKILGKPLASKAAKKQELSLLTGVPALGLDALSSTAYGPEVALTALLPLGLAGLHYFFVITICIVIVLLALYFSYLQTASAYPQGGGAYIVASDNLGKNCGVFAAVALILDYLLNVAVGISAGVGVVVSALPVLHPYTLSLCLLILLILTLINLRGIRESGVLLIIPTVIFIVCMIVTMCIGFGDVLIHGTKVNAHSVAANSSNSLPFWLLLAAFANGLTAMTGVEAVSNAVPIFRKPRVWNAQWTLTIIVGLLALFLLAVGYLCPAYHIMAMDQKQPGYQTVLSQLVAMVTGTGVFYAIAIASIFIVLIYSAQTSFADFPRVCRLLAEDDYLPYFFAEKGRRLVYSVGIIILAIISAALLIAFEGITSSLIPLFAIGAFSAFLFSQIGMVMHWLKEKSGKFILKILANAIGAVITALALIVIIITKFMEGAWIIVFLAPTLAFFMFKIKHHYQKIEREIDKPIKINPRSIKAPIVIIPIYSLDKLAEKAISFGVLLSEDIRAVFIDTGSEDVEHLKELWQEKIEKPFKKADQKIPKLEIINSPYRRIFKPIMNFVDRVKKEEKNRLIALLIPELVEPKWYEYLLHNLYARGLRALYFLERDQRLIVITVPWYLR